MYYLFRFFIYLCIFLFLVRCKEWNEEQVHVFAIPEVGFRISPRVLITTSSSDLVYTTLSIASLEIEVNTTITRYSNANISLPAAVRIKTVGFQSNAIIVRSSSDVTVHAFDNDYYNGDGFLVLPTSQLGTVYIIPNYVPYYSTYPAFFTVTALDNVASFHFRTKTGDTDNIALQPFQSYRFEGEYMEDLTGSFIKSDSLVFVTSGICTWVPNGVSSIDGLIVNVPPVKSWGRRFALAPIFGKSCGYIYRVISGNQTTNLTISGKDNHDNVILPPTNMHEGDVVTATMVSIQADYPVLVVKYLKRYWACDARGDPAMIVVTPSDLYYNHVTFPVFKTTHTYGTTHYSISVIINCSDVDSLIYDNTDSMSDSEIVRLNDDSMCCVQRVVTPGIRSVRSTYPSVKFTVSVYMLCDGYYCSYAYQAGFVYLGE